MKFSIFLFLVGSAYIEMTISGIAMASDCKVHLQKLSEDSKNIEKFVQKKYQNTSALNSGCSNELTEKDKAVIFEINQELAKIPHQSTSDYSKQVSSIITAHQQKLSPAGIAAVVADAQKRRWDHMISAFKQYPKFSESYLNLSKTIQEFNERRDRAFGGLRNINEDHARLDSALREFLSSMAQTEIDPELQKEIKLKTFSVLNKTYEHASHRAEDVARQASLGMAVAGTVLAADLALASAITGGAVAPVAAQTIAGTLSATAAVAVSGAAGGAAFSGGLQITKMTAHALNDSTLGVDFFCKLANEVDQKGEQAVHEALTGAVFGGAMGTGLGALGSVSSIASSMAAKTMGGTMTAVGGVGIVKDSARIKELNKKAQDAEADGDYKSAEKYRAEAQKSSIDAGINSAALIMGAGTLTKFSRSKTRKSQDEIALTQPEVSTSNSNMSYAEIEPKDFGARILNTAKDRFDGKVHYKIKKIDNREVIEIQPYESIVVEGKKLRVIDLETGKKLGMDRSASSQVIQINGKDYLVVNKSNQHPLNSFATSLMEKNGTQLHYDPVLNLQNKWKGSYTRKGKDTQSILRLSDESALNLKPGTSNTAHELTHWKTEYRESRGIAQDTMGRAQVKPDRSSTLPIKADLDTSAYARSISFDEIDAYRQGIRVSARKLREGKDVDKALIKTIKTQIESLQSASERSTAIADHLQEIAKIQKRSNSQPGERIRLNPKQNSQDISEYSIQFVKNKDTGGIVSVIEVHGVGNNNQPTLYRVALPLPKASSIDDVRNYSLLAEQAGLLKKTADAQIRNMIYVKSSLSKIEYEKDPTKQKALVEELIKRTNKEYNR